MGGTPTRQPAGRRRYKFNSHQLSGFAEYLSKHLFGQLSGVGVLVGRMVGREKDATVREVVFYAVAEAVSGLALDRAATFQIIEVSVEADVAEGDDDADIFQKVQFPIKKSRTIGDLFGSGLVLRRGAADGGGDVGVGESESVVAVLARGLIGEARAVKDGVHEIAGGVSGEHATGSVGAVGAGGESEDEHAGVGIAETGYGARPVLAVHVSAALFESDLFAVGNEARTLAAGDEFGVEDGEGRGHEWILEQSVDRLIAGSKTRSDDNCPVVRERLGGANEMHGSFACGSG